MKVETVSKHYIAATKNLPQHEADFNEQSAAAGLNNVSQWTMQAQQAEAMRLKTVEAMDIYLAKKQKCNLSPFNPVITE